MHLAFDVLAMITAMPIFVINFISISHRNTEVTSSGCVMSVFDLLFRCSPGKMMLQLEDIVTDLENWSSGRGVILHGADGTFCSGGDLTLMKLVIESTRAEDMSRFMQEVLTRFYNLPLVSIAFIEGN